MALSTAGHVAQILLLSSFFSKIFLLSFSFRSLIYTIRYITIAHGVPCHTQLRLNASLRIGTSVAVEHDSLSDSAPG
jgi:predicted membrane protein